jgi:hypothetical protein
VSLYERVGFSRPVDLMERRQRHLVQTGAALKRLDEQSGPAIVG